MYDNITPESIKENILASIENDIDKREGSFIDDMIGPAAFELWRAYQSLDSLLQVMFIDTNAGEYIDRRCAEYGIYRKQGAKASGKVLFTGSNNTVIPEATIIQTVDGLQFTTMNERRITNNSIEIDIQAMDVGKAYNVLANTITQMVVNIPGIISLTNNAPAAGGVDIETDELLVTRFYDALQNSSTSGNKNHYKQWALEVNGVGGAKVFPIWNGNGTVKVVIVNTDKKPVDNIIVGNVIQNIEENRPIGATVTVVSASAINIDVKANLTISTETTLAKVISAFNALLEEYLKSIAFNTYTVFYNKIGSMLLDIEGVIDYSNLQVNNSTGNIVLSAEQVPVIGQITLS